MALGDSDGGVRRCATEELGRLGPQAADALPSLIRSLHDPDGRVRRSAAGALGEIGDDAAISALDECFDGAELKMRLLIINAIARIRSTSGVPVLTRMLKAHYRKKDNIEIVKAMAKALRQFGPAALEAEDALYEARQFHWYQRHEIDRALTSITGVRPESEGTDG